MKSLGEPPGCSDGEARRPRISIVTACRNAEHYIAETMESVLQQTAVQSGRVELEYLIYDGKSSDGTLDVVRSLQTDSVQLVSEADIGLYDALSRALPACTGDIVAYINAGDYYDKHAFDVVLDIMQAHEDVAWLTGMTVIYNHRSQTINTANPIRYRRELIRCGLYGPTLPFIQQESTFWRSRLHALVDFRQLAALKLAGDAYLWHSFARECELWTVQAHLGGFKIHPGQLSENRDGYFEEMRSFSERAGWLDLLRVRKEERRCRRKRYRHARYFYFDPTADRWRT